MSIFRDDHTCAHCYYWDFQSDRDTAESGVCRRRAPIPRAVHADEECGTFRSSIGDIVWPVTDRGDWCGDYTFIGLQSEPEK